MYMRHTICFQADEQGDIPNDVEQIRRKPHAGKTLEELSDAEAFDSLNTAADPTGNVRRWKCAFIHTYKVWPDYMEEHRERLHGIAMDVRAQRKANGIGKPGPK